VTFTSALSTLLRFRGFVRQSQGARVVGSIVALLAASAAASFRLDVRCEFSEDCCRPSSLAAETPGGSPSRIALRWVPPSASTSVVVIVISPRRSRSVVSDSPFSTTCSFGTSFTKRPRYVSLRADVLPILSGALLGERDAERATMAGVELMNMASHACRHHPHCERAGSRRAGQTAARGALMRRAIRVELVQRN
jgi:hypothetical protein